MSVPILPYRVFYPLVVATLVVAALPAAGDQPTSRLSETDWATAVRAELDRRAQNDSFSGTVLVAKQGQPIYGLGFMERDFNGVRAFGHGGGAPGMNGELLIFPSGYVVVALSNMDPPAATEVARFIATRLPVK